MYFSLLSIIQSNEFSDEYLLSTSEYCETLMSKNMYKKVDFRKYTHNIFAYPLLNYFPQIISKSWSGKIDLSCYALMKSWWTWVRAIETGARTYLDPQNT